MTRPALMQEFKRHLSPQFPDWDTKTIRKVARICTEVIYPNRPTRPLRRDSPAKARSRYEKGGFGPVGSSEADAAFQHYISLFQHNAPEGGEKHGPNN